MGIKMIEKLKNMEDSKLAKLKKLSTLQEEPNLAIFDELEEVIDNLKELNSKEVKTYEEEISRLETYLSDLSKTISEKEMVVNVESTKKELTDIYNVLSKILEDNKKEQSINVKLVLK